MTRNASARTGAGVLLLLLIPVFVFAFATSAQELETSKEILAVRVREQGHTCVTPIKAEKDAQESRPMAAVWVLECSNATYRIVLHPDLGAQIELVK